MVYRSKIWHLQVHRLQRMDRKCRGGPGPRYGRYHSQCYVATMFIYLICLPLQLFVLSDAYCDLPTRIVHVRSGRELETIFPALQQHFLTRRCPIMMGGEKASTKFSYLKGQYHEIYLLLWIYLGTYFKNAYWKPSQNSLLCDWSMFSSANLSLTAGKMHKN
jgi:hypothetical protein